MQTNEKVFKLNLDKSEKRGVIFDLDGTLLATLEDIANSLNLALVKQAKPTLTLEEVRLSIGRGFLVLVEKAIELSAKKMTTVMNRGLPSPKECFVDSFAHSEVFDKELLYNDLCAFYNQNYLQNSNPYEGIRELLLKLQASGVYIGVHTNKNEVYVKDLLNKYLPDIRFDEILAQNETSLKKPDPTASLNLARKWNLSSSNICYVGDSEVDIQTALAGGFFPLHVSWGFRSLLEIEEVLKTNSLSLSSDNINSINNINNLNDSDKAEQKKKIKDFMGKQIKGLEISHILPHTPFVSASNIDGLESALSIFWQ